MSARTLKEKQQRQKEIDEKYFNALKTAKKKLKSIKNQKNLMLIYWQAGLYLILQTVI